MKTYKYKNYEITERTHKLLELKRIKITKKGEIKKTLLSILREILQCKELRYIVKVQQDTITTHFEYFEIKKEMKEYIKEIQKEKKLYTIEKEWI